MKITLTIVGKPISKKAPRFARRGKFVAVINDQMTEEGKFLWEIRNQWHKVALECPLFLTMVFYVPIPKTSRPKTKLMLENKMPPSKRPDLDNLLKFSWDCLKTEVFKDDNQIISVHACKQYSANPRTEITVQDFDFQSEGEFERNGETEGSGNCQGINW